MRKRRDDGLEIAREDGPVCPRCAAVGIHATEDDCLTTLRAVVQRLKEPAPAIRQADPVPEIRAHAPPHIRIPWKFRGRQTT